MDKIQQSRGRMLLQHPFYATLLVSTPAIIDESIPTLATDMEKIYYNPQFLLSLPSIDQMMMGWAHEILHIVFEHGMRRNGRDPELWNIACDYAINWMLLEGGFEMIDGICLDRKYADMSAEVIYDILCREQDQRQKQQAESRGQPDEQGQSGAQKPSRPKNVLGSDVRDMPNHDPEQRARIERSIKQRVSQAATMARMAGKLSGALEQFVNSMLSPAVPWQDLLRNYMTQTCNNDESWSRRNRRYQSVYLPARHTERMGEIVVIGDVSGSISQREYNRIATEIDAIATQMQPERIRVLWADTQVLSEQVFEAGEELRLNAPRGGGTDMRVPLQHMLQYDPQVAVLITDGYTPWPTGEPECPLIVCCTTQTNVPIGHVVRVPLG